MKRPTIATHLQRERWASLKQGTRSKVGQAGQHSPCSPFQHPLSVVDNRRK